MARPRVFISSTFYDLKYVREDIARCVRDLGYESILFEKGEIPYGKNQRPEEYCYKEIELCDVLVSIIGGRYGSESSESGYSVTQKELRQALEVGKQVYIFVDKNVQAEFETYKINKDNEHIKFRHVDNRKVYEFLEEVYELPRNNPIFSFESSQEIVRVLKEQWSGLFQRLLSKEGDGKQLEMINALKSTMSTLQNIVKVMSEKNETQSTVMKELILLNHPAFSHLRFLLNSGMRIVFMNYEEFTEIMSTFGYWKRESDFPFDDYEDWINIQNGTEYTLQVAKNLFDKNGMLVPESDGWSPNLMQLHEREMKNPFAQTVSDELPF